MSEQLAKDRYETWITNLLASRNMVSTMPIPWEDLSVHTRKYWLEKVKDL